MNWPILVITFLIGYSIGVLTPIIIVVVGYCITLYIDRKYDTFLVDVNQPPEGGER